MKLIVVTRSMHSKEPITLSNFRGDFGITITDMIYTEYKSVMGVFKTAESARQFIEKDKEKLIEQYGEIVLDDEYIKDGHTYYTYGSCTKDLGGMLEGEKTINRCKFRSQKNCAFCSFHSDCDEYWREGDKT